MAGEAPSWLPFQGILTAFVYLLQFFILAIAPPDTGGNLLVLIGKFAVIQAVPDVPGWLGFLAFMMVPLPWLVLAASYVFSNAVTGTIATIVGAIAGLVAFFT